jgi:hypothetical protein
MITLAEYLIHKHDAFHALRQRVPSPANCPPRCMPA